MKIEKKKLTNWQISQQKHDRKLPFFSPSLIHRIRDEERDSFRVPRSILQQPELTPNSTILREQNKSRKDCQVGNEKCFAAVYYRNYLRDVLMSRKKQLFRPLKRHYSLIDTQKIPQSIEVEKQRQKCRRSSIALEQSPQKTIDILQKVILRDVDFYAKEKPSIELLPNKLPIIGDKLPKRKQFFDLYEGKPNSLMPPLTKFDGLTPKVLRIESKKQVPYLSGWQFSEPNDF